MSSGLRPKKHARLIHRGARDAHVGGPANIVCLYYPGIVKFDRTLRYLGC